MCNIPVGIMHGADDKIVKPESWVKSSLFKTKTSFDYIASQQKKIYFSLSNKQNHPPLVAFHNQAVTDTTYFDNALFKNVAGVKQEPNAYNFEYIWPDPDKVVKGEARADELLNEFPLETIDVKGASPPKPSFIKVIELIPAVLSLLGLGYWL